MYIDNFEWTHEIGYRPHVDLKISDVNEDDFRNLRELAAKGDKIKIERKGFFDMEIKANTYPVEDVINAYNIALDSARYSYSISDVERMKKMFKTKVSGIRVEKVIFNKPATIVFWSDNTKTVVVCGENDVYDAEKGFFIACAKKLFGNDYKAVGRMNKALEMAVVQTKEKK